MIPGRPIQSVQIFFLNCFFPKFLFENFYFQKLFSQFFLKNFFYILFPNFVFNFFRLFFRNLFSDFFCRNFFFGNFFRNFFLKKSSNKFRTKVGKIIFKKNQKQFEKKIFVRTLYGLYWPTRYHAVASQFLPKKKNKFGLYESGGQADSNFQPYLWIYSLNSAQCTL